MKESIMTQFKAIAFVAFYRVHIFSTTRHYITLSARVADNFMFEHTYICLTHDAELRKNRENKNCQLNL